MKKFLCCLLALTTLGVSAVTAVSCGGGKGDTPPVSSSIDASQVTLRLKTKTYNIENGQSVPLSVEFALDGEELDLALLSFTSNDPSVATVDENGIVTGVSGGSTGVTVAFGTKSVKATIKVTMRENRLTISDESCLLPVGQEKQLTAKAYFGLTELTDAEISWESSNSAVATVSADGLVQGVGNGKAVVTASFEGISQSVDISVLATASAEQVNTFDESYINIFGRSYVNEEGLNLDHAASGVELAFSGTSIKMTLYANANSKMRVFVDGDTAGKKMDVSIGSKEYTLASGLSQGVHTVRVVKGSEEIFAQWDIESFDAEQFLVAPEKSDLKIEFIGTSAMTGYGIFGSPGQEGTMANSDSTKSYAYLAAHELDADYSIVAMTGICATAFFWAGSYNMEGLYNTVSAHNAKAYSFDFNPDIVVLNLGSVESSYITRLHDGNPSYAPSFSGDYQRFLSSVRQKNPDAFIICLYGMINMTPAIQNGIRLAIENLADDRIVYNPFEIEYNNDGAINHPSASAQKQWADELVAYIRGLEIC